MAEPSGDLPEELADLDDDTATRDATPEAPSERSPLAPVGGLRRRSAGGAMLAAAMIGVQEVLEGPKDDPIVLEIGSGADGDDDPLALDLDPYDPSASVAVVRPWLRDE